MEVLMADDLTSKDPGELVRVYESGQESETQIIVGLLESAEIECTEISIEASQDVYPGVGGTAVCVLPEDAEEARKIIENYRENAEMDIEQVEGGAGN
jgi:hypothetical protein